MRSQRIKLSFAPSIFLWSRREIDSFLGRTMYFECTAYVLLTDNNLYDAKAQPADSHAIPTAYMFKCITQQDTNCKQTGFGRPHFPYGLHHVLPFHQHINNIQVIFDLFKISSRYWYNFYYFVMFQSCPFTCS